MQNLENLKNTAAWSMFNEKMDRTIDGTCGNYIISLVEISIYTQDQQFCLSQK